MISSYINHVKNSFINADSMVTKLSPDILLLEGMSGFKTRVFYNEIASGWGVKYLEIGAWKGSSTCSALFSNSIDITTMDNWSLFNGPVTEFMDNVQKYRGANRVVEIEADSFELDVSTLPYKYNVYLYDGAHSDEAHEQALTHYINAMEDTFIFMVDDWMYQGVRKGTYAAIEKLGLKIEYYEDRGETIVYEDDDEDEVGERRWWAEKDGKRVRIKSDPHNYWNGIGVFVLTKP